MGLLAEPAEGRWRVGRVVGWEGRMVHRISDTGWTPRPLPAHGIMDVNSAGGRERRAAGSEA